MKVSKQKVKLTFEMISFKISSIGQTEKYNPETEYLGDLKK